MSVNIKKADGLAPACGGVSDGFVEGYYYNSAFYQDTTHTVEIPKVTRIIYIDIDTNSLYRYNGSVFISISSPLKWT